MKFSKYGRFLSILIAMPVWLHAQHSESDSIEWLIAKYRSTSGFEKDTNYINTLNDLAFRYNNIKPDTTIILSQQIVELCDKVNYPKGKVEALKNIGLAYNIKGQYNQALSLYEDALAIAKSCNYIKGEARIYHNSGIVYSNLGKYPEALEKYFQALKIRETLDEKVGIASTLNGIGAIYFVQGKYGDALETYDKALKIAEEINFTSGIESSFANIGEVYFRQEQYEAAQSSLLKALNLTDKTGNKETKAFIYYLMASIYLKQQLYDKAITAFLTTKEQAVEIGSQEYIVRSYLGMGEVYLAKKDYKKALLQTQAGIVIAKQIAYKELLRDGNRILSKIYEAEGSGMKALYHHKLFKLYADSINNQETEKRATNLAAEYEYSKREIVLRADQQKREFEFQKQTNQQRWIIFSAFAALFSLLVVLFLIYRSRQKQQSANQLLQKQNEEIENQKIAVEKAMTVLKSTQSQLIQSEKMASLGELTAGIAHEIQNPLNFVNNFSELNRELLIELRDEMDKGNISDAKEITDDVIANEEKINYHGKRADFIVKGMLAHSRSQPGEKLETDINRLAKEYLRLTYQGLKTKFNDFESEYHFEPAVDLPNIEILPQEMGRAFFNLMQNAFYAVYERKNAGDPNYKPFVDVMVKLEDDHIKVVVRDNGIGIPASIRNKIFQPFFTTKPTGQGTGLGLSLSYDIVKAHGGEIKLHSEEHKGSEFIIILPVK